MPRFRYSLRTLFIVVTLAAIPCAWLGWQARIVAQRKSLIVEIEQARGHEADSPELNLLPWYRRMFGDKYVQLLLVPITLSEKECAIQEAFPESGIVWFDPTISAWQEF